ncbi:MAG: hypothetical protein ACRCU5_10550 [Rhizobiaceae bacterium]
MSNWIIESFAIVAIPTITILLYIILQNKNFLENYQIFFGSLKLKKFSNSKKFNKLRNTINVYIYTKSYLNRELIWKDFDFLVSCLAFLSSMIFLGINLYFSKNWKDALDFEFYAGIVFFGLFIFSIKRLWKDVVSYTKEGLLKDTQPSSPFPKDATSFFHIGDDIQSSGSTTLQIRKKRQILDTLLFDESLCNAFLNTEKILFERNDQHNVLKLFSGEEKDFLRNMLAYHANRASKHGVAFTNDKKIRLNSVTKEIDDNYKFSVEKTYYYTSQITNKMMPLSYSGAKVSPIEPRKFLNNISFKNKHYVLSQFQRDDRLSNHLGGVQFSISSDGFPLLSFQSSKANEQRASGEGQLKVVPTGAGSIDWKDIAKRDSSIVDAVRMGLTRELFEETNTIYQNSIIPADNKLVSRYLNYMQVSGFYRSMQWAGLPIFVGFCRHFQTFERIQRNAQVNNTLLRNSETIFFNYKTLPNYKPMRVQNHHDVLQFLEQFVFDIDERFIGFQANPNIKIAGISDQFYSLFELIKNSKAVQTHVDIAFSRDVSDI